MSIYITYIGIFRVNNFLYIQRWLNRYDDVQASIYKPGKYENFKLTKVFMI